mgnify:CR=1 FL=1
MIVDSSALVAIMNNEPEAFAFNRTIHRSNGAAIAAPTYLETSMVLSGRRGPDATEALDVYIAKLRKYLKDDPKIEIVNIHGNGFRLVVQE